MNRAGLAIFALGVLLFGCDSEKDQYAGLSDIVADRQEVRKTLAEENARKKSQDDFWSGEKDDAKHLSARKEEPISTVVVYEKQIEILDADSKIPLAKGVAYMNKSGQIVRIKVYRK